MADFHGYGVPTYVAFANFQKKHMRATQVRVLISPL